jgi:hypothetical protein
MRNLFVFWFLIGFAFKAHTQRFDNQDEIYFRFLAKMEASIFLSKPDFFTNSLSALDISLRRTTQNIIPIEDHLIYLGQQGLDWDSSEINAFNKEITDLKKAFKLLGVAIRLPPEILLIKTTGKDEFSSAYTRKNAIIIPKGTSARVFAHEFFHVLSRYHPELQDEFYEISGFFASRNLELIREIKEQVITNPDAVEFKHYLRVLYHDQEIRVIPIVTSNIRREEVTSKVRLDEIIEVKLAEISENELGDFFAIKNGNPVLIDFKETNYLEAIRANTQYIIHPEEIAADHFVLLIQKTLQKPGLVEIQFPKALEQLHSILALKSI